MKPQKNNNVNESSEILTGSLANAMAAMAAREPTAEEIARAMIRLERFQTVSIAVSIPDCTLRSSSFGWSRWIAASFLISCIWFAAQTSVWGNVAVRYQEQQSAELSSPKSNQNISFDTPKESTKKRVPSQSESTQVSPKQSNSILRFVLLLHVLTLLLGFWGMALSWAGSSWNSFRSLWQKQASRAAASNIVEQIHRWSLVSYGAGMVLGCIWLMSTQGTFWSWTSREMYGLLTLAIACLWHQQIAGSPSENAMLQIKESLAASIGFGAIVLLYRMGMLDTSKMHTYPMYVSHNAELVIFAFFGSQAALLIGIRWWRLR